MQVADVTSAFACLGLWGPPRAGRPAAAHDADLSNEAFGYMRARDLSVGPVPCLALRVTYVGELGWELYCPTEFGLRLWDLLWEAGRPHGLSRAATGRSTRCGWRRATACGVRTSRRT